MVTSTCMTCIAGTCFFSSHSNMSSQPYPHSCHTGAKIEYNFLRTYRRHSISEFIGTFRPLYKIFWSHPASCFDISYRVSACIVVAESPVFDDHAFVSQIFRKGASSLHKLFAERGFLSVNAIIDKVHPTSSESPPSP